jgi:lysophospholipase L1-like esterase
MKRDALPGDQTVNTSTRRLSWGVRLGLIFFGLFLTFVMLEAGLRIVSSIKAGNMQKAADGSLLPPGEYWAIYEPELGYRQNPRFGDLNSDGLRDYPIGPKDGRFRLLFLGDSIAVYGDSRDDTFVGHLRADLGQRSEGKALDIINAGIRGYTNYQELLYLKKYGLKFQPDLVGLQFCLNDLHRFLHSFRVEDGKIVPGTYVFSSEALSDQRSRPTPILERSYLWLWMKNRVPIASKAAAWIANDGFSFDYQADISRAWQDEPWEDIENQLGEMVELGSRHHFRVFVAIVPVAAQYNLGYLSRDRNYVLKPQQKLREICERKGIDFYDLYPDLKADHFLEEDGLHLTGEGRRVVGKRLAAWLAQSQLLPQTTH